MDSDQNTSNAAVSSTIAIILIIALVVIMAAIIGAFVYGVPDAVQVSAMIKAAPDTYSYGVTSHEIPYILPMAGDAFYFDGMEPAGHRVKLRMGAPDGVVYDVKPEHITNGTLYGRSLYIYTEMNMCEFRVTDDLSVITNRTRLFPPGSYAIQLIDEDTNVLIGIENVEVKGSGLSLPHGFFSLCGEGIWGRTWGCEDLSPDIRGNPTSAEYERCVDAMCAMHFSGNQDTLVFPDSTDFDITEDLAIGIYFRPEDLSSGTNHAHQLFGKGVTDTDDNYEMFTIGDEIYFEWADQNGNFYHIMTDSANMVVNNWQYVNLVIENNQPSIYVNGVPQVIHYYNGNNPWSHTEITSVPVQLRDNDNPITIGSQQWDGGSNYYFVGDIGEIAIYGRGMTSEEILDNFNNCRA